MRFEHTPLSLSCRVEVKCEFCKRDYVLQGKELEEAYAQASAPDGEDGAAPA